MDGCWWIAYTLHFGGRKRRVRRSLKTKSLEEAIRLRDVLLARIRAEGEEVPERRRPGLKAPEGEGEMRTRPTAAMTVRHYTTAL